MRVCVEIDVFVFMCVDIDVFVCVCGGRLMCLYFFFCVESEYLGARIEANGKSTPEIRRRLAMATTRLTKMISICKGQCKKNKTESPRDSGIPNCLVWV